MKFIQQYKNLSKEIYILFFGRVVTSMGSLIWPLLTLILKNKLGYNATTIATITMAMSILQFPMLLLGGKLADTMNRKKIIVCCDMVTVISYIICGLLPLSGYSIALFYLAGVFATIEGPSYDALVADLSDSESREKAYSLQYLGMNLGLVLSPTIAGFLFENYLGLAFIITGIATFSSTLLIILFVKQLRVEKKKVSEYEEKRENEHVFKILWERRPILIYALVAGFGALVYAQFNYLLPLNMETLYGAKGAAIFGMLTSTNALVVIIATPIITTSFSSVATFLRLLDIKNLPCLSISHSIAPDKKNLTKSLAFLLVSGRVFNLVSKFSHSFCENPNKHPSKPLVIMNFSPISSLSFAGIINLPLASKECSYWPN